MNQIENCELKTIYGGGLSVGTASVIVVGIVFIIGVIDGFLRPYQCRE